MFLKSNNIIGFDKDAEQKGTVKTLVFYESENMTKGEIPITKSSAYAWMIKRNGLSCSN